MSRLDDLAHAMKIIPAEAVMATDSGELFFHDHITRKTTAQSPTVTINKTIARYSTGPLRMIFWMIFFITKLRSKAASLRRRSK